MKKLLLLVFSLLIINQCFSETITTTYTETDNLSISTTTNVIKYVAGAEMYVPIYIVGHITAITSDGAPKEISVVKEVGEISSSKLSNKEIYALIEGEIYKEAYAELYLTAIGVNVKE